MISLVFFFLAGAARGISELVGYEHGDSIFSAKVPQHSFWGAQAWKRKYRTTKHKSLFAVQFERMTRLKKWYYKAFKIKYEEAFPLSATALVWLTDGMHLMNFLMKFFLIAACVSYAEGYHWAWMIVSYTLAWTGGFNLTYSLIFSRRLK